MSKVFDPKVLQACANKGLSLQGEAQFDAVITALSEAYPHYIELEDKKWLLNYAGGCKWNMCLLYASWSEYLMIVGSSVGTSGFTGRYRVNIQDFLFDGEVWYNYEGETDRKIYRAGDISTLNQKQAALISIPNSAWMIEYAHGLIPSMVPFGLIETFTSTLDWRAFYRTSKTYLKCVLKARKARKKAKADLIQL